MVAPASPAALERTLWADITPPVGMDGPLSGSIEADVVIIGGGYAGLSAALHVAEAGRSVVLIEAVAPGAGASGRNAGGWVPYYLDRTPADLDAIMAPVQAGLLNRMIAEAGRLVPEIVARHGIDCDLDRSGVLVGSGEPRQASAFRQLRTMWAQHGGDAIDFVGTERMRALTGSDRFSHGLLFRDAGTLNPLAYARGLAAAAMLSGARIYCGQPALRITSTGHDWHVATADGSVRARHVLIATEGYGAVPGLWPGLEHTHYQMPFAVIASEPAPDIAGRLLPAGIPIADANKANPFWAMTTGSGHIVGSLLPPRGDRLSPAQVARFYEAKLTRIHGPLPPIRWSHFWTGTVAISLERVPRLLRLGEGLYAVGGFSGQGIAAATAIGREYGAIIAHDGDTRAGRLPVFEMKPVRFRRALPVLMRSVLAPLGRRLDRSYRDVPGEVVEE